MLRAAAAGRWGCRVLLPLLDAMLWSQPSVVQATLSQVTETQAAGVLMAVTAGNTDNVLTMIQQLPAVQDLGAGSLLGVLQAAVEVGSAEIVHCLAALPAAAGIGAAAVEGLLRTAVGLIAGSRELCHELCKLPGAQGIGPVGLVLLLEAAVHALDVESMMLLPVAAEICPAVLACLVNAAKAAGQGKKARALSVLLND